MAARVPGEHAVAPRQPPGHRQPVAMRTPDPMHQHQRRAVAEHAHGNNLTIAGREAVVVAGSGSAKAHESEIAQRAQGASQARQAWWRCRRFRRSTVEHGGVPPPTMHFRAAAAQIVRPRHAARASASGSRAAQPAQRPRCARYCYHDGSHAHFSACIPPVAARPTRQARDVGPPPSFNTTCGAPSSPSRIVFLFAINHLRDCTDS